MAKIRFVQQEVDMTSYEAKWEELKERLKNMFEDTYLDDGNPSLIEAYEYTIKKVGNNTLEKVLEQMYDIEHTDALIERKVVTE